MPNTAEQAIYDRLASAPSFHPANAELLLNEWTLEPGDVVTVKSGEQNYSLPVYSLSLNWTGSNLSGAGNSNTTRIAIESTGHKEREPLPELRRKQFEQGRYAYTGFKAQQQEIDEHYQHVVEVTDKGMSDAFGIIGVSIGADGYPVKDGSGNYVWDDSGTGGEIWGHLNRNAWATQILNHIKDANGNVISLAEVYTDAYGQAIINAINDQRTGTAQIKADRIKIDSTSGSSFSIDSDGTMTFNAENAIAAINAATAEINAGKIALNSTGTITLASKLGINANGLLRVDGGAEISGALFADSDVYVGNDLYIESGHTIQFNDGSDYVDYYPRDLRFGWGSNGFVKSVLSSSATEIAVGMEAAFDSSNIYTLSFKENTQHNYNTANLTHYHDITATEGTGSNAGKILFTLGAPRSTEGSTNFNIAATQFYINGVAARTAHSISRIELTSSDTGSSSQPVTVYSLDDWEEDLSVTVNASAVYSRGMNDVGVYITKNGSWYTSWTIQAGDSETFYPAKWINGSYVVDYNRGLTVTASGGGTDSSNIDLANAGQIWLHSSDPGSGYVNLGSLGSRITEGKNNGSAYVSFQATCDGGTTYKYYKIPL